LIHSRRWGSHPSDLIVFITAISTTIAANPWSARLPLPISTFPTGSRPSARSTGAMERNRGREAWPVDLALGLEPVRRLAASVFRGSRIFSYTDRGRYRRQLDTLERYFPKEQILLLDSEALDRRYEETLRSVYGFLGIPIPSPLPAPRRVRQTERKYRPLSLTLTWLRWVLRKKRRWLRERFPDSG